MGPAKSARTEDDIMQTQNPAQARTQGRIMQIGADDSSDLLDMDGRNRDDRSDAVADAVQQADLAVPRRLFPAWVADHVHPAPWGRPGPDPAAQVPGQRISHR